MDICPKCGLPLQACVCDEIVKNEQKIKIRFENKKFGKIVTIVSGFQGMDLKIVAKDLKQELACGGTVKNNAIELQGDHSRTAKKALIKLGFSEDSISVE
jgi:translation initiation factor 1